MTLKLRFWLKFLLIFLCLTAGTRATLYKFLVEDTDIFEDCENEPNYLGVADIMDMSKLEVEYLEDGMHVEGDITLLWDADPNDRIELRADLYRYERGVWQPTVFTMIQKDFCQTLFNEGDIWYNTWSKYVEEGDAKCINNKGHTYHHIPFDMETVFEVKGEDISGRHKAVIKIDAYDRKNDLQPYSVCLQVLGDILKK